MGLSRIIMFNEMIISNPLSFDKQLGKYLYKAKIINK